LPAGQKPKSRSREAGFAPISIRSRQIPGTELVRFRIRRTGVKKAIP
jgi:hypothetical protein